MRRRNFGLDLLVAVTVVSLLALSCFALFGASAAPAPEQLGPVRGSRKDCEPLYEKAVAMMERAQAGGDSYRTQSDYYKSMHYATQATAYAQLYQACRMR